MIATTDEQNEAMALGRPMLKLSDDRLARWQPATISAGARASASAHLALSCLLLAAQARDGAHMNHFVRGLGEALGAMAAQCSSGERVVMQALWWDGFNSAETRAKAEFGLKGRA